MVMIHSIKKAFISWIFFLESNSLIINAAIDIMTFSLILKGTLIFMSYDNQGISIIDPVTGSYA